MDEGYDMHKLYKGRIEKMWSMYIKHIMTLSQHDTNFILHLFL